MTAMNVAENFIFGIKGQLRKENTASKGPLLHEGKIASSAKSLITHPGIEKTMTTQKVRQPRIPAAEYFKKGRPHWQRNLHAGHKQAVVRPAIRPAKMLDRHV